MIKLVHGAALVSALAAAPLFAQTAPAPAGQPAGTATAAGQPAAGQTPAAQTPSAQTLASQTPGQPAPGQLINPKVGGATMDPAKPIPVNAAAAPNLSSLTAAVRAAGLEAQLSGPGPFTVFAPTDAAFGRLAPGTMDTLLKPENKAALTKVLTYHVVAGTITLADLKARLASGGGTATLTTLAGDPLTVSAEGNAMSLADTSGNKAYVEIADVRQSNGVVHVINGVVVPKLN